MWLNGHLFSDHSSISSRRRERLPVLSLVMKILRKPKIEDIVCNIQNNEEDKEAFIVQYQPFIRKSISSVCRRYITEQDDEYSIGLFAFNEAIEQYSYKRENLF